MFLINVLVRAWIRTRFSGSTGRFSPVQLENFRKGPVEKLRFFRFRFSPVQPAIFRPVPAEMLRFTGKYTGGCSGFLQLPGSAHPCVRQSGVQVR